MGHYKSNVRDLEFNLFELLELEKALATGEFGDLDGESVRQMLDEHLGTGSSGVVKRDHSQRLYMLLVLSIWAKWFGSIGR